MEDGSKNCRSENTANNGTKIKLTHILGGSTMSGFRVRKVNLNPLSDMDNGSVSYFIFMHLSLLLCKMEQIQLPQEMGPKDDYKCFLI